MTFSESELLSYLNLTLDQSNKNVELGVGDDCSVLKLDPNFRLVVSTDTLNSDVHFFSRQPGFTIGWRAVVCALSDLAAMGAEPFTHTLSFSVPSETSKAFAHDILDGVQAAGKQYASVLVGGDTVKGALSLTVTVLGKLKGTAMLRGRALAGDYICLGGALGEAATEFSLISEQVKQTTTPIFDREKYHATVVEPFRLQGMHCGYGNFSKPLPQLSLAKLMRLHGVECAIDISDGIFIDLKHIAKLSGVGYELQIDKIPIYRNKNEKLSLAATVQKLSFGDDYRLCFAINPSCYENLSPKLREQIVVVGAFTKSVKRIYTIANQVVDINEQGYEHKF